VGAGTAGVTSVAQVPDGPTWGQRTAFNAGQQVNRMARNAFAAGMIGVSEAMPVYRGAPNIPAEQAAPTEQFGAPVAPEEPSPVVQPSAEDAEIDRAFAEDADYQTGSIKLTGRARVTRSGRQLISLDNVTLTPGQRQAAIAINGQQMDARMQAAWRRA